jgi:hypothetical protein
VTASKFEIYTSVVLMEPLDLNSSELNSFGSGNLPEISVIIRNIFSKLYTSELIIK